MSALLLGLLERLPAQARRGLVIVVPVVLLGVLVAGLVLAASGAGRRAGRASSAARVLPPSPTSATHTSAPGAPAAHPSRSPASRIGHRRHSRAELAAPRRPPVRGPVSEQPPAAPATAEGAMLLIARRFAIAYMPYQVGRLPGWARDAIERTCTPAFARYLLAQPAQPTALQAAHPNSIETYRVASVAPAGGPGTAAVSYLSRQSTADTGEFLLRLIRRRGRWLVAGLEA